MPIHADPQRIRDFRSQLASFLSCLQTFDNRLSAGVSHLGQSWRDQEFQRFRETFTTTQGVLKKFASEGQALLPKLEKDAQALDELGRTQM